MFFFKICVFFLVLALGQCQRLTTTDQPWIWGEYPTNIKNPSVRTTTTSRSIPTTSSNEFTTPFRKNQPTPRTCPGCPITPQFNPVCGSDMATYANPNAVDCANMCGPKIEILFYAACQPTA